MTKTAKIFKWFFDDMGHSGRSSNNIIQDEFTRLNIHTQTRQRTHVVYPTSVRDKYKQTRDREKVGNKWIFTPYRSPQERASRND